MKKDPNFKGTFHFATDIGLVRLTNEDQAHVMTNYCGDVLMIVCDGMGGQNKGDYASRLAMEHMIDSFRKKRKTALFLSRIWLVRAMREANAAVYAASNKSPIYENMGTTCVAVLIQGNNMIIMNVGDSRAYSYDNRGLNRLTSDQTYVDYLARVGKIEDSEKETRPDRHVLMNALGIYPSLAFDICVKPYCGETILVCSDGLYNNLSEPEIRATLSTDDRTEQKVSSLISEANHNGGSDNIAVALWEASRHD